MSAWNLLRGEPYRLFFPLGLAASLAGATHWILIALGWRADAAARLHGLIQVEVFGACFAAGFILTFLPRMLGGPPPASWELAGAAALAVAGLVLLELGRVVAAQFTAAAFLALLAVFLLRRARGWLASPPPFTFLLLGLAHGIAGALLTAFPLAAFPRLGERMVEQGLLLCFVLGVGSFLGARMAGVFNPADFMLRRGRRGTPVPPPFVHLALGTLLFASFWIEAGLSGGAGRLLRAAVVTTQLARFGGFRRLPPAPVLSVWLLWTSFILTMAGLWGAALAPEAVAIVPLHVTYVGGLGLMMLMMGVRITTMHTGADHLWQRATPSLRILGWGALAAMVLRVAANVLAMHFPSRYPWLVAAAAVVWNLALAAWAVLLFPRLWPRGVEAERDMPPCARVGDGLGARPCGH